MSLPKHRGRHLLTEFCLAQTHRRGRRIETVLKLNELPKNPDDFLCAGGESPLVECMYSFCPNIVADIVIGNVTWQQAMDLDPDLAIGVCIALPKHVKLS